MDRSKERSGKESRRDHLSRNTGSRSRSDTSPHDRTRSDDKLPNSDSEQSYSLERDHNSQSRSRSTKRYPVKTDKRKRKRRSRGHSSERSSYSDTSSSEYTSSDSSSETDSSPLYKKKRKNTKHIKKKRTSLSPRPQSKKRKRIDSKKFLKKYKNKLGKKKIVNKPVMEVESMIPSLPTPAATVGLDVADTNLAKLKASLKAQPTKRQGPMTKEDYEKQQSVVRRVLDPDTGRYRLVKGDGEIIEEIVSRERHKAINKQATLGDGQSFQAELKKYMQ